MTHADSLLETSDLQKRFGGVRAVDGVDFRLRQGELRCLIGPNGAGKSTFFKLLSGQLQPSGGLIRFEGVSIGGMAMHQIARVGIGIKNQVPSVFERLAVHENLWIAARSRHPARGAGRTVDAVIERLACADFVLNDWPRLGRFAAANAALAPAKAGERRVVFFGDSITDNWSKKGYGGFFPGKPYLNRGIAHEQRGDTGAAAEDYRQALAIDPTAGAAQRRLKRLQSR